MQTSDWYPTSKEFDCSGYCPLHFGPPKLLVNKPPLHWVIRIEDIPCMWLVIMGYRNMNFFLEFLPILFSGFGLNTCGKQVVFVMTFITYYETWVQTRRSTTYKISLKLVRIGRFNCIHNRTHHLRLRICLAMLRNKRFLCAIKITIIIIC